MSVYLRSDSPHYHYDFEYKKTRHYGSTGRTTLAEARAFEKAKRAEVKAAVALGHNLERIDFDAAAGRWWKEVGQFRADPDRVEKDIARLVQWVGASTPLVSINDEMVARLVAHRRMDDRKGRPELGRIKPSTVNNSLLDPLMAILNRARDLWGIHLPNAPTFRRHVLPEDERIRELTAEEELRYAQHESDDYRPPRLLMQVTGLRVTNACKLRWEQIDLINGVLTVTQKGNRVHRIPITPRIRAILESLRGHHPVYVFTYLARKTGKVPNTDKWTLAGQRYPIAVGSMQSSVKRTVKKAGIVDFRVHDLRHTAATRLLRRTGNLKAVQSLLGHRSIQTTMRYAHFLQDDLRAAMTRAEDDDPTIH